MLWIFLVACAPDAPGPRPTAGTHGDSATVDSGAIPTGSVPTTSPEPPGPVPPGLVVTGMGNLLFPHEVVMAVREGDRGAVVLRGEVRAGVGDPPREHVMAVDGLPELLAHPDDDTAGDWVVLWSPHDRPLDVGRGTSVADVGSLRPDADADLDGDGRVDLVGWTGGGFAVWFAADLLAARP